MNRGTQPVRRNVLYDNTGEPCHLLHPVSPKRLYIETKCGIGHSKNVLIRGRIRIINLRNNRLSCTLCQDTADRIIAETDNCHQGDLYED